MERALSLARAIVVGAVLGRIVSAVGAYGYLYLSRANLRYAPEVPWAPLVALPLLWLYWRYLGGWGWPRSTSAYRLRMRRANPIPSNLRAAAVAASLAGYLFVLASIEVAFRLADLPAGALRMLPPGLPWWTSASALIVLAMVAGVTEETGYRGYAQKPVEEAGFPVLAILLSAALFTMAHASKTWFLAQAVPMFVAAIWYGTLTWATRSIYPMIAVHVGLDLALFLRYEILRLPAPESVHHVGLTPAFWLSAAAAVVLGTLAFALTARLARGRRSPARLPPRSP